MPDQKLGEAFVEVRADTRRFSEDLRRTRKDTEASAKRMGQSFKDLGQNVESSGQLLKGFRESAKAARGEVESLATSSGTLSGILGKAGPLGLALAAGSTLLGTFAVQARRATAALADIGDQADQISVSTDTFQSFTSALILVGQSTKGVQQSLRRFNRLIADAAAGTGEGKRIFDQYGIAIKDAEGNLRPFEEVLNDVADVFKTLNNSSERTRVAFTLFERAGGALVPVLEQGSEGIARLRAEAEELGLIIREDTIREAQRLNVEFEKQATIVGNQLKEAFVQLAPELLALTQTITPLVTELAAALSGLFNLQTLASNFISIQGEYSDEYEALVSDIEDFNQRITRARESGDEILVQRLREEGIRLEVRRQELQEIISRLRQSPTQDPLSKPINVNLGDPLRNAELSARRLFETIGRGSRVVPLLAEDLEDVAAAAKKFGVSESQIEAIARLRREVQLALDVGRYDLALDALRRFAIEAENSGGNFQEIVNQVVSVEAQLAKALGTTTELNVKLDSQKQFIEASRAATIEWNLSLSESVGFLDMALLGAEGLEARLDAARDATKRWNSSLAEAIATLNTATETVADRAFSNLGGFEVLPGQEVDPVGSQTESNPLAEPSNSRFNFSLPFSLAPGDEPPKTLPRGGGGIDENARKLENLDRALEDVREKIRASVDEATILERLLSIPTEERESARKGLEVELGLIRELEEAKEDGLAIGAEEEAAFREQAKLLGEQVRAREKLIEVIQRQQEEQAEAAEQAKQEAEELGAFLSDSIEGLKGLIDGSEDASTALLKLASSFAEAALQAALFNRGPLKSLFGGSLSNLFGGFGGGSGSTGGGSAIAFADGGVIDRPIVFPIRGGRIGLAGESGPEGIFPLGKSKGKFGVWEADSGKLLPVTRDAQGRLAVSLRGIVGFSDGGVVSGGGIGSAISERSLAELQSGGGGGGITANFVFPNNSNVEEFRQSQASIAAGLTRLAAQGRRNS